MLLPSWIRDEVAALRQELSRFNRDLQGFGKRVRRLEDVLQQQVAEPSEPPPSPGTATGPVTSEPPPVASEPQASSAPLEPSSSRPWQPLELDALSPSNQPLPDDVAAVSRFHPEISQPRTDWEAVIGARWMTWVGAFTLLLAVGFAVQWAWATFETPPWLQVLGLHLLGVGMLIAGHVLDRRGMPLAARAVAGLAIFTLYASAFAALHLYKVWGEQIAFLECTALTVLAIAVALRADSAAVILLGALGGYLTPLLTSSGSGNYVGLFTYLAFLNVALVACAVWRAWSFLKPLALLATAAMFALWIGSSAFDGANHRMVWGTEWFAVLHALVFLVGSTIPPVLWKRTSDPADLAALTLGSFFFIGITWTLFHSRPDQQLALVSWGMAALHGVLFGVTYARVTNTDRMPRVHLALAAVFLTLAIPLQLDDAAYWGATWCVEGFIFTAVGVYFRDRQMCVSALAVFVLAAVRLAGLDFPSPPRTLAGSSIDLRFLLFLISGLLALLAGGMYRLIPWAFNRPVGRDEWLRTLPDVLAVLGAVLVTLAPPLQVEDKIYLGPAWCIEALAFTAVGLLARDRLLYALGLVVFTVAGVRLLGDLALSRRTIVVSGWNPLFLAIGFSSLMAMVAGSLYWLVPKLAWGDQKLHKQERTMAGGGLLAVANLALMAGLTAQWEGRFVLVLWTLDAAVVWAAGFRLDRPAVRWYGAALAIVLVGGRAFHEGYRLDGPFLLIFNERFESLVLVAALYFAFGAWYRRRFAAAGPLDLSQFLGIAPHDRQRSSLPASQQNAQSPPIAADERWLDPLLGILANVVLLMAITFEIRSWYAGARAGGWGPFPDMRMAEMATYSIVWAIYAAVVVAAGFVLRYPLFRILGMAAFAPILLKVFFLDLAELRWLPRVLALAVLGLMLLGVSMLYQKFATRLQKNEQPLPDVGAES